MASWLHRTGKTEGLASVGSIHTVRATRNFGPLKRGQEVVVDVSEEPWASELKGGNVEIVADESVEEPADVYSDDPWGDDGDAEQAGEDNSE